MRTARSDRFTSAFLARPNFAVRPFSSFWWSGKDGDDDDGGGGDEKDGKGDGGNKRNPSSSSSSSSKRPRSGPLNVAGGSNVIDVESSSSSRVREGSSDNDGQGNDGQGNDGQGNDGQGSASDGDDDGLTDFERAARIVGMDVATVGEGEDAPRIRPLLVMPRSGSPIFPVPELAQHMLLQDEALVELAETHEDAGIRALAQVLLDDKPDSDDGDEDEDEWMTDDDDDDDDDEQARPGDY